MYLEVVTFIPITFLVFIHMIILSIKAVGPLYLEKELRETRSSTDNANDAAKGIIVEGSGVGFFSFLMGLWVVFIQIITIISLSQKPQYTITYLIDSNKLFMSIMIFLIGGWTMMEVFASFSKWQLVIYISTMAALIIIWLAILSDPTIETLDFLEDSLLSLIIVGCISWLIMLIGIKRIFTDPKRQRWITQFYSLPNQIKKLYISKKVEVLIFIGLFVLFLLSWADIPIF
ncbi:MAG: hypothetical protein ACTSRZ_18715 [Promethearchaeota archaeon]